MCRRRRARSVIAMNEALSNAPLPPIPAPQSAPVVQVRDLHRTYGVGANAVHALRGINLDVTRGSFTAIMGPSGSGKSTLMHILAGLDAASSGSVQLAGQEITTLGDEELTVLRRRKIGFVFQAFNLVPVLTVRQNVLLPYELDDRKPSADEVRYAEALIESLGLQERSSHRPHELSGGQQQRVAIARALARYPEIVFADEPTGNLDSRTSREVLTLLRAACTDYQQSIIMVTHDPVAASYADRILFLADGQIVRDAGRCTPEQISEIMLGLEQAQ